MESDKNENGCNGRIDTAADLHYVSGICSDFCSCETRYWRMVHEKKNSLRNYWFYISGKWKNNSSNTNNFISLQRTKTETKAFWDMALNYQIGLQFWHMNL